MSSDNQSAWSAPAKASVTSGHGNTMYCYLEDTDDDGTGGAISVFSIGNGNGGQSLAPSFKVQATNAEYVPPSIGDDMETRALNNSIQPSKVTLASINPTGTAQSIPKDDGKYHDVELKFSTDG